ncbi:hypothetical protein Scep_026515 [Stephania cephalantha]|uniref:Uncharacterized protein n=1 Tax=Stephania cephalantha TaxID=152367 RepID=A0AAP0EKA3_9MAGN
MELLRLAFFGTLLMILGFCHCSNKSVEVNGLVECSECSLDNIESAEVLSGHQILISCKVGDEQFETRGIGEVKDGSSSGDDLDLKMERRWSSNSGDDLEKLGSCSGVEEDVRSVRSCSGVEGDV